MIDPNYEFVQRRKLNEAVSNMRLMGAVFAGLGGLPLYMMYDSRASLALQILAIVDTAVLIGPGVWYFFGAHMIRQLQMRGVRISLRIACAQLAAVVMGVLCGLEFAGQNRVAMMLPALLATFFVPALIALMVQLAKARGVIRLLNPEVHAFEAIPVAAIAPIISNAQGDSHGPAAER
jgi:hypothetical protein